MRLFSLYPLPTYMAEKRSSKEQDVSGHIKLNISATIDGERIRTPFHEQYTKLHEVRRRAVCLNLAAVLTSFVYTYL